MILGSDYTNLLLRFPPRILSSEEEYEAALAEIDILLSKLELSEAEQAFLALLSTLVQGYEEKYYPAGEFELRGLDLLKGLMELHNLRQRDLLPIFKTRSIASAILNGHRRLTVEHINKLAAFFGLPHELFFEPLAEPIR